MRQAVTASVQQCTDVSRVGLAQRLPVRAVNSLAEPTTVSCTPSALPSRDSSGRRAIACTATRPSSQAPYSTQRPAITPPPEQKREDRPPTEVAEWLDRAQAATTEHPPSTNGDRPHEASGGQQSDPTKADSPMDLVFVTSEVAPWSKTGGLGDVMGSLPIAMARRGHRVMVVAPRYLNGQPANDKRYDKLKDTQTNVTLDLGTSGVHEVGFFHLHEHHVDWVFVDHPSYQRPGNPYADQYGAFGDNVFRFSLLSMAACEAPLQLNIGGYRSGEPPGFPYGERVLFMANDWHAALVPAYLGGKYRRNGVYREARSIFAIHNLSHQGVERAENFGNLGLPGDWYGALAWEFPSWAAINGPAFNILKGAVAAADRIVTVSQGYAWEITTVEGGWGLHGVLQSRAPVLNGIVNGIDLEEWDPEKDEHTPASFSATDLSGKARCKAELQRELGLPEDPHAILVGWVGRLDHQKGPDVVIDAVPGLVSRGCQVIMLGSGDQRYEDAMREQESRHPQNFRGWVGFSVPVSHRIIAGCDALLMPSRFEPCGLNQLFAMRYGTVPIAHATGGLRDTIKDFNPFVQDEAEQGTGWTFSPPDAATMLAAVDNALVTFREHKESWSALMRNGMAQDLSWDRSAVEYERIFGWALLDPPNAPS